MKMEAIDMDRQVPMTHTDLRSRTTLDSFPRPTSSYSVVETHISLVFLTDSHVYKTKKPVHFPFVDYSTLDKRFDACQEEIRVNRRLAPHVYLSVIPVTRNGETVQFGGDGEVIDYAVEMLRLPDEDLLDHRIVAGRASTDDIRRLLDLLIPFYEKHPCEDRMRSCASFEEVWKAANENVQTMLEFVPDECRTLLSRLRSSQLQYLHWERDQFASRMNSSEIVEGHGDLRPEHICMSDPPVIFDAVEFSQVFRTADVASELAFLAMELDFLNAHALGKELIDQFQSRSNRQFPKHLFSFYQAYRATVRAKVHLLQCDSGRSDSEMHQAWFRRYLHLAAAYSSDFHRPIMVTVMGLSGAGKSTIARELSRRWGSEWIRTDQVRQELSNRREPNAPFAQGMYAEPMTTLTYRQVAHRAEQLLRNGISVLVDGTFLEASHRDLIRAVASDLSCPVLAVWCDCPDSIARKRILDRTEKGNDISDARLEIYERQLESLLRSSPMNDADVIRVDTSGSVADIVDEILSVVRKRFPHSTRPDQKKSALPTGS